MHGMISPKALHAYIRRYQQEARQLDTPEIAEQWWALNYDLHTAIAFANRGFFPKEATSLINKVTKVGYYVADDTDFQDLINVLTEAKRLKFSN